MAFRQPAVAPIARPISTVVQEQQVANPSAHSQALEDSREWILFPSRASAASYTQATSTDRTPRTAGLSRLSDFGSLNTAARSSRQSEDGGCEDLEDSPEDEDEGLDSLDDGLHAFQEPSKLLSEHFHASSNSILPQHDGLGGFLTKSPGLEEQAGWPVERDEIGSRKRSFGASRRWTSMNMERGVQETVLDDDSSPLEGERRERIEKWRLEHSRVLLDEVEKETRRRRASFRSRISNTEHGRKDLAWEGFGQVMGREQHDFEDDQRSEISLGASMKTQTTGIEAEEDNETFWQRVTRRVIRDYIGIDDTMLSIILGEALPEEDTTSGSPPAKAPRLDDSITHSAAIAQPTWDRRLINRVTRELSILLDQLSDHRSTTYTGTLFNPTTSDYAGISLTQSGPRPRPSRLPSPKTTATSAPPASNPIKSPSSSISFTFAPTLQLHPDPTLDPSSSSSSSSRAHAALWGIEEEPISSSSTPTEQEQREYWESRPTFKEIFTRFLHSRFPPSTITSPTSTATTTPPRRHPIATTSTPDTLRRAALIRQHHPLTSSNPTPAHRRRSLLLHHRGIGGGSSCASESAWRSGGRSSVGGGATSTSRNYWDLDYGGGGGSSVAGSGGWGKV